MARLWFNDQYQNGSFYKIILALQKYQSYKQNNLLYKPIKLTQSNSILFLKWILT